MRLFQISSTRVLTNPLHNGVCKYICFEVSNQTEHVWFVQWFNSAGIPVSFRIFEDSKEFERYYDVIKKSFRNEKQEELTCHVAGFKQGEEIPF